MQIGVADLAIQPFDEARLTLLRGPYRSPVFGPANPWETPSSNRFTDDCKASV